jgi:hypothetical protein
MLVNLERAIVVDSRQKIVLVIGGYPPRCSAGYARAMLLAIPSVEPYAILRLRPSVFPKGKKQTGRKNPLPAGVSRLEKIIWMTDIYFFLA